MNISPSPPSATLVYSTGEENREHQFRGEDQYLGREPVNDIVIADDEQMSGRHLRIFLREGRYFLEDTNSTNGTFLNGERIASAVPLDSGDLIKAGRTILKFLASSSETIASPPVPTARRDPGSSGFGSNPEMRTRVALNLADVRFNLGLVYFKKGDYATAIKTWEREMGRRKDDRLIGWIDKARARLDDAGD